MVVSLLTGSNIKLCAIGFCRKSVYAISPVIRVADAKLIPIEAKYVLNLLAMTVLSYSLLLSILK